MARMLISSAMGMNRVIGGGARSIRGLSSATKDDTIVEELKEMGIRSVKKETVHQKIRCIKAAREDKMFRKASLTWLMAGVVLGGSTFASTLVAEADARGMEPVKEEQQ